MGPSTDNSGQFVYLICCVTTGNVTVPQTRTSHTIEGLQSGKTYTFRVYAWDAAGNTSKSSNAVTVTLPGQIAAPTTPVVQVLDAGPTHASLSWVSTDDGPLIWDTIFIDGQAVRTLNSLSFTFTCASVAGPTYCIPFDQETTYAFTVQARDSDSNHSPTSDPVLVTTEPAPDDFTPPTLQEGHAGTIGPRTCRSVDDDVEGAIGTRGAAILLVRPGDDHDLVGIRERRANACRKHTGLYRAADVGQRVEAGHRHLRRAGSDANAIHARERRMPDHDVAAILVEAAISVDARIRQRGSCRSLGTGFSLRPLHVAVRSSSRT